MRGEPVLALGSPPDQLLRVGGRGRGRYMQYQDYYQILGVERSASAEDIKRSYRKLARKYHPDVSKEPDAEAKFKQLNEAYEVLKDPEKRTAYDAIGSNYQAGQGFTPPPDWNREFNFGGGGFTAADAEGFSDFFENLFGGRQQGFHGQSRRSTRGEDVTAAIEIELAQAWNGAQRTITLSARTAAGQAPRQRSLNVRIPKGVYDGQHIRLAGQGEPGVGGGPSGDLYLEIHIRPQALFKVTGRNLHMSLPLAPWEAALGASVTVPTPGGPVELKIPPDTPAGRQLRLRGRGLPSNPPGDLYAQVQIVLPPARTAAARAAYESLAKATDFEPRAHFEA